jgi:hypothetical protein
MLSRAVKVRFRKVARELATRYRADKAFIAAGCLVLFMILSGHGDSTPSNASGHGDSTPGHGAYAGLSSMRSTPPKSRDLTPYDAPTSNIHLSSNGPTIYTPVDTPPSSDSKYTPIPLSGDSKYTPIPLSSDSNPLPVFDSKNNANPSIDPHPSLAAPPEKGFDVLAWQSQFWQTLPIFLSEKFGSLNLTDTDVKKLRDSYNVTLGEPEFSTLNYDQQVERIVQNLKQPAILKLSQSLNLVSGYENLSSPPSPPPLRRQLSFTSNFQQLLSSPGHDNHTFGHTQSWVLPFVRAFSDRGYTLGYSCKVVRARDFEQLSGPDRKFRSSLNLDAEAIDRLVEASLNAREAIKLSSIKEKLAKLVGDCKKNKNNKKKRTQGSENKNEFLENENMILGTLVQCMKTVIVTLAKSSRRESSAVTSDTVTKAVTNYLFFINILRNFCQDQESIARRANQAVSIVRRANQIVASFINYPDGRLYSSVDLAEFLVYLLISENYSWKDVCEVYLSELFKRHVGFMLRKKPHLSSENSAIRMCVRLRESFEASLTSLRTVQIQVQFLLEEEKRNSSSVDLARDTLRAPDADTVERIKDKCLLILREKHWGAFFQNVQMDSPRPRVLEALLLKAIDECKGMEKDEKKYYPPIAERCDTMKGYSKRYEHCIHCAHEVCVYQDFESGPLPAVLSFSHLDNVSANKRTKRTSKE